MEHDPSCVFSRDSLDAKYASNFAKPWIFQTEDSIAEFDTEDEACAAQRAHRRRSGFHEITGECS